MVNNILECYHPLIFLPSKKIAKKRFILDFYSGITPNDVSKYIQYRSELWDHLFFDNCLNYPNLNYVSEKICSLN